MPDRDLAREYGRAVGYPSGFRTWVNGKPVTAALERKAVVKGIDHRRLLERLGIPVAPASINEAVAVMDRLPPLQRQQLVELGLAGVEEWDNDGSGMRKHLIPLWTVQDKWWWRQTFASGRPVMVEHRYVPGVGGAGDTPLRVSHYRDSDDARWAIDRYCVGQAFLTARTSCARKR
jgi:hypothetical protein